MKRSTAVRTRASRRARPAASGRRAARRPSDRPRGPGSGLAGRGEARGPLLDPAADQGLLVGRRAALRASAASRRPATRSQSALSSGEPGSTAGPLSPPRASAPGAGEVQLPLGLDRAVALDAAGLEERLDVAGRRSAPRAAPRRCATAATASRSRACSHRPIGSGRPWAVHHGGASVISDESGFIMRGSRTHAQPETAKERRPWHWHTSPWRPAT